MPVCAEHACERSCSSVHAQQRLAILCNNPPQGRGVENGLSTPVESEVDREEDAGANVASFLQAAADQTGLMALAEGDTEGTTGKTLTRAGKNLKGAEWQSRLFGSFPSAQIYFTMSQTISHSGCLARVISRRVWMCARSRPPSSQPNLYN